jgi:hypothetical protein
MKTIGIIILVSGIMLAIFTGYSFVTKKKVVDIGTMEITTDKNHNLAWSPLIGVGVMAVGGLFIFYGLKKH